MARIAGVDIPRDKKLPYSLSYIYGIGLTKAKFICDKAKLSQDLRVKDFFILSYDILFIYFINES